MRQEIGGYLEMERFSLPLLHEKALALASGRACLAYLISRRGIRKLALPDFVCDVVAATCAALGVSVRRYPVELTPRMAEVHTEADEWLYVVNYYGQLTAEELAALASKHPRLIVDNAQAYFTPALPGVDTLYTCRKFFGVADGGFLYTDAPEAELPRDESRDRMAFVLGRFERPAGEYYEAAARNNEALPILPVRRMSRLTENLLRGIDYEAVRERRNENFRLLHEALGTKNRLRPRQPEGPFAYPFRCDRAAELRRALIAKKIFVPTLWPNVLRERDPGSAAYALASDILPLPCDQRYGAEEMAFIAEGVCQCLR